jgi:hypothetical protein
MSGVFDLSATFQQLIAFAIGGLVGSVVLWCMMLNEMFNNMPSLPWRAQSGICKFFGMMRLTKIALEAEARFREAYGYTLIATMRDLGGPRPLPQTEAAMDALLAEAERRFQLAQKGKAQ